MGRTIQKKNPFLKKRLSKTRRGLLAFRSRQHKGLRTQTAKPAKHTKAGRALNRRQKTYSRNMRRIFGMNTGRRTRRNNNNIEMANAMEEALLQAKEARRRRSSRVQGKNIDPEAAAAVAAIASGKRISRAKPATTTHIVPTPTTAYVKSLPSRENSNDEAMGGLIGQFGKIGL